LTIKSKIIKNESCILEYQVPGGKVNPIIDATGVSAIHMKAEFHILKVKR
jgi:Na+-transporting methylmalonyl-CoA/oxaloacetate decarboxylase beta subunit